VLAQEFLRRNAVANGKEGVTFSASAIRAIDAHAWPGNVRELENRVKRAVIMAEGKRINAADLELESPTAAPLSLNLKEARESAERDVVERALRKHAGKIAPASTELGISRPTLYELMEKLGIARAEKEAATE
jgi:two-component system NtrC family response regulator